MAYYGRSKLTSSHRREYRIWRGKRRRVIYLQDNGNISISCTTGLGRRLSRLPRWHRLLYWWCLSMVAISRLSLATIDSMSMSMSSSSEVGVVKSRSSGGFSTRAAFCLSGLSGFSRLRIPAGLAMPLIRMLSRCWGVPGVRSLAE
ncbi:uncharacterized protein ASPGLDRAFT_1006184 [Aspergillus glaucus CBS 516.65]|uniref:Uncharacterized protein n=1 Tax=Aspergillus glaucus CBS 516.65 TaxID=1160497 RepID=A0A1L9VVI5_ASPGL|nr:hypothetical protein ASPGLDRAFT_1006184 [Aspergillus glaucus CBS 516.65]OJJ87919.1 hypothetical protein ASPGLDRAFT_1006184 [Aspergillus glaucus CBS 516.65]